MSFLDRDKYGMYKDTDKQGPGPTLMGADTLLGEDVANRQDEDLGDIKEIMIDMRNGEIAYAVLSFGGVMGVGEKLFAVPWQALELDTDNKRFVLDVDKERLKSAPGFDKDAWPDMADITYVEQIHTFYGTDPSRRGSMGRNLPMDGMVGGATRGAGASSMGAGHAGSGAGSSGSMETASGAGMSSGAGTSSSSGASGGAGSSTDQRLDNPAGKGSTIGSSAGAGSSSGAGLGSSTGSSTGASGGAGTSSGVGTGSSGAGTSSSTGASGGSGTGSGSGVSSSGSSTADSGPGTTGSSGISGSPPRGGGSNSGRT